MMLETKILSKNAQLAVVGLGYVGLPLALEFIRGGFKVHGIDVDQEKVQKIKDGVSYVADVREDDLRRAVESGRLEVHSDYSVVSKVDCVSICVPTPLRKTKDPDISYIMAASHDIRQFIHKERNLSTS